MLYADDLVILAEKFEGLMTKMAVWKNGIESKVNMGKPKLLYWVEISIHCKLLVNILEQYEGKVSERTQSSVVDVYFGFTKSVLIF